MVYQGSFQDIFLVLAGLAWVGYSAYRSNKKREHSSATSSPKNTAKKGSIFEELLEQYTQGVAVQPEEDFTLKNDADVATKPRQTESSVEVVEQFTDDDIYEKNESEQELADESALDETEIHTKDNGAYNLKKQLNNRTFNLKRAFIYSEILNKKYS